MMHTPWMATLFGSLGRCTDVVLLLFLVHLAVLLYSFTHRSDA